MKILFLDTPGPKCGVNQVGSQFVGALRKEGHEVTHFECQYPNYPPREGSWDVVHVNFHPGANGYIQTEHLPPGLRSVWSHEYSPEWEVPEKAPSLIRDAQVLFCSDPESPNYSPLPIPDYKPLSYSMLGKKIRIGWTGLRGDGLDWIEPICKEKGWILDTPRGWLPLESEIDRLSRCHLNVVHSHSGFSGSSSAATLAIAARRPVLVNSGKMLNAVRALDSGLSRELYHFDNFREGVEAILEDIEVSRAKRPLQLASKYSFSEQVQVLLGSWRGLEG